MFRNIFEAIIVSQKTDVIIGTSELRAANHTLAPGTSKLFQSDDGSKLAMLSGFRIGSLNPFIMSHAATVR
jgi:hypothetical protein